MKNWTFALLIALMSTTLHAENNTTNPDQLAKHVKEQMKREEIFARTQEFKQGDDYNLTEHMVDPKDLESIQVDPPEYDFDMNDVYD